MSSLSRNLAPGQWVRRVIPPDLVHLGYTHDGEVAVISAYPSGRSVEIRFLDGYTFNSFVRFLHPIPPEEAAVMVLGQ